MIDTAKQHLQQKKNQLVKWYYTQDTQQRFNIILVSFTEGFKMVMATLLSIFVAQSCNGNVCSFTDNLRDLNPYNVFILAYNFLTLGYFIYLYYIEIKREDWMIRHFDANEKLGEDNILQYKRTYPTVFNELDQYNAKYARSYKIMLFLYTSNAILSGFLLFYYYFLDFRTVSGYLTNILLCSTKILRG